MFRKKNFVALAAAVSLDLLGASTVRAAGVAYTDHRASRTATVNATSVIQEAGGPPGAYIGAIAIDPRRRDIIYAATGSSDDPRTANARVYKSTDGGESWLPTGRGLSTVLINVLVIDPSDSSTLYAGTSGGVFKGANEGQSWTPANFGLTNLAVQAMAIDPVATATVYAGTAGGGVFKSTDRGATWAAVNFGLTDPRVFALAIDPARPATMYAGGSGGVFKSINGGQSWTAISSGLASTLIFTLTIDPANTATLYAGASSGNVFKSTNAGVTWSAADTGIAASFLDALVVDPANTNTLYAAFRFGGVFKSTNGGVHWNAASSGLTNAEVRTLAIDPFTSGKLYAGTGPGFTGTGVFKSSDGAASWVFSSSGLTHLSVTSLAIDPLNPAVLYAGSNGGLFKSSNGGTGWNSTNAGFVTGTSGPMTIVPIVVSLALDPLNSANAYAATGVGVFKSTNGGQTWSATSTRSINAVAVDPTNPATIYAGGTSIAGPFGSPGSVLKSTDGGASWAISEGLRGRSISALAIDPLTPATVYAGTTGVVKSTDGGANWSAVTSGLANLVVSSLAIDPANPATIYAGTAGGVFKSVNGRASWASASSGLGNLSITGLAIDPSNPSTLYAGTRGGGIFKTTDGGRNWTAINSGLTSFSMTALVIGPVNATTLYAGTVGAGAFKSTDGGATWQPTGANTGGGRAPATTISRVSGDNQVGFAGETLPHPLVVVVTNSGGIPVAGVLVTFAITAGSGTLSLTRAITDSQGVASTKLTLGPTAGVTVASANSPGLTGSPVAFSAIARSAGTPVVSLRPTSLVFSASFGENPAPQTFEVQNAGSGVLGWTATVGTESGGNWLSVSRTTGVAPSAITVSISSARLAAGAYTGTINIAALPNVNASNSPQVLPVGLAVDAPLVAPEGVVNGASFSREAVVSPASIASLFGSKLAKTTASAGSLPLPTILASTQVLVNNAPAPLFYVSPTQINFQLPVGLSGPSAEIVVVSDGVRGLQASTKVAPAAPGIFTSPATGTGQGSVLNEDSSLNGAQNPAAVGSVIQIFATGLGDTIPPAIPGHPAGSSPLSLTVLMPVVLVEGVRAEVLYSGLAPGLAGVYQINARVPVGVSSGPAVPLQVQAGGRSSNTVSIAVRQRRDD